MVKKDELEDEDEDLDDDEDEEEEDWDDDKEEKEKEEKEIRGKPKKETSLNKGNTFSSYHIPERIGIKNDKTNQPVAEDQWTILAEILTRLERIEEKLG